MSTQLSHMSTQWGHMSRQPTRVVIETKHLMILKPDDDETLYETWKSNKKKQKKKLDAIFASDNEVT